MDDTKSKDSLAKDTTTPLLFFLFYVLGTISLVPQYFYITANDYWMFKFRDLNVTSSDPDAKTELQQNFTAYYSNVATVCTDVFLGLTIVVSQKVSLQLRIVGPLVIILSLFIVTSLFVWIDTDSWQTGFFYVALIIAGLTSAASGCFLISIYELSSKFPPSCLGAQVSGESLCGILAAVLQIFTLSLDVSSKSSALVYFLICVFLLLATIVFYVLVSYRSKAFQRHINKKSEENGKMDYSKFGVIVKKMGLYVIPMILTVGIGVMVFPGVTSLIESTAKGSNRWGDVFFVPVCTFLAYHVSDLAGREVALRFIKIKNIYVILAITTLRLTLIPLLMLCNIQPRNHLSVVFGEDYEFIIFQILFAFSSGYLLNLTLMLVPRVVEAEEKALAMFFAIFAMVLSSGLCSFLTSVMVHAI